MNSKFERATKMAHKFFWLADSLTVLDEALQMINNRKDCSVADCVAIICYCAAKKEGVINVLGKV